jgi:YbbR domain-containing protein
MRAFLHKVFIEDALLKLFSLSIALLLFLVRSDLDAAASAYVRVNYNLPQDWVMTSEPLSEVKVVIRGPWGRANRFVEGDIGPIQLELSKHQDGELRLSEDMLKLPAGLRVGSFTPPSVYLSFEPIVERTLPVQVVIEGEPRGGYRVGKVRVTPKQVRVSGAKGAVELMHEAQTRPLRVTGLSSPVEMTVKLAPPPRFAHYLDSPDISVYVEVERSILERTYSDVQIKVQGSSPGNVTLSPEEVAVVLRGPALALEQVHGTPELTVDASPEERKPPGTYRKRIQVVNLPPDIAAELRPSWVLLTTERTGAPVNDGKRR